MPTIIILFIQVIVSFLATNSLVKLSQTYQVNNQKYDQVISINQKLKSQFYQQTSKTNLQNQIKELGLFPIQKSLDTNQWLLKIK